MKEPNEDQNGSRDAVLDFLARNAEEHPERLRGVSQQLVEQIRALTADASVDLDEPIYGLVSL